jgi:hypothetical protein
VKVQQLEALYMTAITAPAVVTSWLTYGRLDNRTDTTRWELTVAPASVCTYMVPTKGWLTVST